MKTLFSAAILGLAFSASTFSSIALGAQSTDAVQAQEKAMKDCFEKHAGLMAKPAVKNLRDCWRTHGYLMQKS